MVMECEQLVRQAAAGVKAFVELTRRFPAISDAGRTLSALPFAGYAGPALHCSWSWRRPVIAFVLMSLCDHRSSERVESGTRRTAFVLNSAESIGSTLQMLARVRCSMLPGVTPLPTCWASRCCRCTSVGTRQFSISARGARFTRTVGIDMSLRPDPPQR
jgi:hypothetical protein